MKLVTPKQMNDIDAYAINMLGIPGIVLMENAALRVVDEIVKTLDGVWGRNILVLAGKGNNGGDAFAAARHLSGKGAVVNVYLFASHKDVKGDALINLDILKNIGLEAIELTNNQKLNDLKNSLQKAQLIIDGIYGTGLKGGIDGLVKEAIDLVNGSGKPVLAIDIPSGVIGDTGKIQGICIKATKTVTFCLPKTGLVVHPGCEYTGELAIADIGIPKAAVEHQEIKYNLIDNEYVSGIIPKRFDNSNKGSFGKVLLLTGSTGMTGSGCLCAKAALRTGAGLVYLGVPASLVPIYGSAINEPVVIPFDDAGSGRFVMNSGRQILERMQGMDVVAVGPGMSVNGEITSIIGNLIEDCNVPLILDADALNAISGDVSVLKKLRTEAVLTPHPGEMARLTGLSIKQVQENRIDTALEFAVKWGVVIVLKGSRTVVALPDGTVYVNTSGNPGMATGGTGDVLTGIIAGLAGQGVKLSSAAAAGVFLHGLSGDMAAGNKGQHGMTAGDMVEALPYVIKKIVVSDAG